MPDEKSAANLAMAAQIRAEQSVKEWTQSQLAQKSGVNFETLKRVLKGTRDINVTQMAQLAGAFGITPVELMRRAVERIPDFEKVSEVASTNNVTEVDFEKLYVERTQDIAAAERTEESNQDEDFD